MLKCPKCKDGNLFFHERMLSTRTVPLDDNNVVVNGDPKEDYWEGTDGDSLRCAKCDAQFDFGYEYNKNGDMVITEVGKQLVG